MRQAFSKPSTIVGATSYPSGGPEASGLLLSLLPTSLGRPQRGCVSPVNRCL